MTKREFDFWLEGYTASIMGAPTEGQWAKIQKKLAEIEDPEPVVVRDWGGPYWRYWGPQWIWTQTPQIGDIQYNPTTTTGSVQVDGNPAVTAFDLMNSFEDQASLGDLELSR